jgi:hypothetical protein
MDAYDVTVYSCLLSSNILRALQLGTVRDQPSVESMMDVALSMIPYEERDHTDASFEMSTAHIS